MVPDDEFFFDSPGSIVAGAVDAFLRPPEFTSNLWRHELYARLSYFYTLGLLSEVGFLRARPAAGFDGPWRPGLRSDILASVVPKQGWEERFEHSTALRLSQGPHRLTVPQRRALILKVNSTWSLWRVVSEVVEVALAERAAWANACGLIVPRWPDILASSSHSQPLRIVAPSELAPAVIWWTGHCSAIAALTPIVLPLLKEPLSARQESILAREATLRHLFFVRLQAYAEFFWEHQLHDLVRNAEEYIHVRLEFRSQAVARCYRSVDAPQAWCIATIPDYGWELHGSEYRGYRHLRPVLARGVLSIARHYFERYSRASTWTRRDEFFALHFSAVRAYEAWERAAAPLDSIRKLIAVLSIASKGFWKGVV